MINSFIILNRIETQTYRLTLLLPYRIYIVFHMSLLKLYKRKTNNNNLF